MGCLTTPALYGPLITTFVGLSYLGSIPFWWKAGKAYKNFMEAKDEENARLAAAWSLFNDIDIILISSMTAVHSESRLILKNIFLNQSSVYQFY